MRKIIKKLSFIVVFVLGLGITVAAAETITLLETHTNTESFSLYVKGMQVEDEVTVQIATGQADNVEMNYISELDVPMQTLIMIDNSISIPNKDRDIVSNIIQNIIADRLSNERIAISTFSEDVNMLTDYTNDYSTLKKALDSITYQNQETYLTDVLYDLISNEYVNDAEDIYQRIIVISDGVDNKSIGYTKDELNMLLKEYQIPIYTIGCSTGKNNIELENMFAISRLTFADYFLLDDIQDIMDITDTLRQDRDIVKITVTPPDEIMDGSKKAVKITSANGESYISVDIVMPQKIKLEIEEPVETEENEISEVESTLEIIEDENNSGFSFIVILVLVFIVVLAVVVGLVVIFKKKTRKTEFEQFDEDIFNQLANHENSSENDTEIVEPLAKSGEGNTIAILDQISTYQIVLTDVKSPTKTFYFSLNNSVIVGRKKEFSNIEIDYDKSVSGKHCEISTRGGKFYVKDLQSKNGTYINNSKVISETEIISGNILKLGLVEMKFEVR
jgi:hypothetical protein